MNNLFDDKPISGGLQIPEVRIVEKTGILDGKTYKSSGCKHINHEDEKKMWSGMGGAVWGI